MIRLPILHLQYQWLPHWPSLTLSNGTNTLRVWPVISAHCLRFVYFIVCTAELYFISPLPFHAPGSTVILCSFTHLFPSSLLMLPVVHRRTGPAPKHAESQWWCRPSVEFQSHLNLSTAQLLSTFLSLCFSSLLQMYFLAAFPSPLYEILLCCLFSDLPRCCSQQPDSGILNRSNTQPWLLLPFHTFLFSLTWKANFSLLDILQWMK